MPWARAFIGRLLYVVRVNFARSFSLAIVNEEAPQRWELILIAEPPSLLQYVSDRL
jgi:hypothetical protein